MIFRFQSIAVMVLLCFFMMLLTGIDALNNDISPAEILMTTTENCVDRCLLNIRPSKSTVLESMNLLENHPWVNDIIQIASGNGYAQISWGWSGKQPFVIDENKRGRLTFYYDDEDPAEISVNDSIVETVTLYTHIPIYSFQDWFGETNLGSVNNRLDGRLGYIVYYKVPDGIITLSAEMICPATIVSYWNATSRITVSMGNSKDPYINPSDLIQLC